ncbi:glycosyltransferase [Lapillicoccus jejuensis]|uniref:UDP-N-acetylglucosamine:LPS N-acetylglucosamine transferase n=1 Tax=Lapillicoccus jejuensis TaxID=402171 RepID=A0A542DXI6_9MICO|nr:glycosyltransferase [Lapillicoccus jejuensis]TQJ07803.1 UDP-N-acetylglucosamine:LPS N-acetylglucosamine transferase [Lapillicoccus jejuensis]
MVPRDRPGPSAPEGGPRGVVGWYAHHAGSGHVTRALAVAAHTRHEVVVLGSARRPSSWPAERWVALPDDAAPLGADPTAGGALHWAPTGHPGFTARMRRFADWVVRVRPVALVVDVSVEVALLGRLLGVPVVVTVMAGDRSDRAHRLGYDAATALVAAWPAAVGPAPVRGWRPEWTPRTHFTGALSRLDDVRPGPPPRAAHGGARTALRLGGAGAGGWWAHEPAPVDGWRWTRPAGDDPRSVADALAAADVVVLHGGQNALAEVAATRRPAVVVPDARPHDEQRALADAVAGLGAATVLDDPWAAGPAGWAAALDDAHRRGGEGWAAWSDRRGARRYAAVVDAVADQGADEGATSASPTLLEEPEAS